LPIVNASIVVNARGSVWGNALRRPYASHGSVKYKGKGRVGMDTLDFPICPCQYIELFGIVAPETILKLRDAAGRREIFASYATELALLFHLFKCLLWDQIARYAVHSQDFAVKVL